MRVPLARRKPSGGAGAAPAVNVNTQNAATAAVRLAIVLFIGRPFRSAVFCAPARGLYPNR